MTKEEILQTFSDINYAYNNCSKYDTLKRMLDELTEDMPSKQKMGRWIESDALLMATNEDGCMKFPAKECSVCHKPHIKAYWMDYCPNCGAKMVESEEAE